MNSISLFRTPEAEKVNFNGNNVFGFFILAEYALLEETWMELKRGVVTIEAKGTIMSNCDLL